MPKRTASNSSNLSDKNMDREAKKIQLEPIIPTDEQLPADIKSLAVFFAEKLNNLNSSINTSLEFFGAKLDEAISKHDELSQKFTELELKHEQLLAENTKLKREQRELKEEQLRLETFQRRNNAVFSGVDEKLSEKAWECKAKLIEKLNTLGANINFEEVIGRCHRLGPPQPGKNRDIIAHFPNENNKFAILNLKDKFPNKMGMHEDLPPEISSRKRELMPIFKLAKSKEHYKHVAKMKQDKLMIGRTTYTVRPANNLHQLPPDLDPIKSCSQDNEYCYVFFGKHHPFSNFNDAVPITINGEVYPTSEHFIQEQKALLFNNKLLATQIKQCDNAFECKRLAKEVSGFQFRVWKDNIPSILHTALTAKYEQNEQFRLLLSKTDLKKIGEATRDRLFGTGFTLTDETNTNHLETNNWSEDNLMGIALERVRDNNK